MAETRRSKRKKPRRSTLKGTFNVAVDKDIALVELQNQLNMCVRGENGTAYAERLTDRLTSNMMLKKCNLQWA